MDFSSKQYQAMLRLSEALHSSLELRVALDRAVPILEALIGVDHLALAVSKPGSLYDYQWYNNTLPERFLGEYTRIADQDFVRAAVASRPNEVLRDHEMISRQKLKRHVVYTHSRDVGANLEHVMAVMLLHEQQWSSGLSLYRARPRPFSDDEARMLQLIVPQLRLAVRNSRQYSERMREALLEPVVQHAGLAVIWLDANLREVTRTPLATQLLQRYFARHERRHGDLPEPLLSPLQQHITSGHPGAAPPEVTREYHLSSLHISYLPLPEQGMWALLLRTGGVDGELERALEQELPPRLLEIAACVARGMSNDEIAAKNGTKLSTVKQQVSDIYRRLGVRGRKGFIQLATGLASGGVSPVKG